MNTQNNPLYKMTLPQLPKFSNRSWCRLSNINGTEKKILRQLHHHKIPFYWPRTRHVRNGVAQVGTGLFSGTMFVAFSETDDTKWLSEIKSDYIVYQPMDETSYHEMITDLRFMKLAEHINCRIPFRWEILYPKMNGTLIVRDEDGYGFMALKEDRMDIKLFFYFKTMKRIISFTVNERYFLQYMTAEGLGSLSYAIEEK